MTTPVKPMGIVTRDLRPIPDPTVLTTQQLQREIASARELTEGKIAGFRDAVETRLSGMDRAVMLLQTQTDRLPAHVVDVVHQLQSLHEEKFKSIEKQFVERDTRTEQTSRDSKVAVDAALQAAKEAVGEQNRSNTMAIAKSEATFTKQIDQIGVLITTLQKGLDDKIDDIKGRLGSIESVKKGAGELWGFIGGAIGLVVAVATVAVALASIFYRR